VSESLPASAVRSLKNIVGPEHVLTGDDEREEYAFDAFPPDRVVKALGGEPAGPAAIVRPGSTDEVRALVRLANESGTPIVPFGAGTGVMGAAVPVRGGLVIDLGRMQSVRHLDADGLVVQVEAGIRLKALNDTLRDKGLMLGHDPWSQPIATLGGAISTDGVGYLAARYGSMGEQVLGLEVVLPDGELIEAKNISLSAGAVPHRLFVGAEGALGIITAAVVRAFPMPETRMLHAIAFESFAKGYAAILAMGRRDVRPSMIDYSEEPLVRGDESVLYLAFEGMEARVAVEQREGLRLCEGHGGRDLGQAEARRFWDERHLSAERWERRNAEGRSLARREAPWTRGLDYLHLALPVDRVLDYRERSLALIEETGLEVREVAIWGRPDLFSLMLADPANGERPTDLLDATSQRLLELAQDMGGSMEYCHGVGLKLQRLMERELGGGMLLLRAVKSALDPGNIMNPGKLGL
jgi:FAD/FMN-containing dehydrogenase